MYHLNEKKIDKSIMGSPTVFQLRMQNKKQKNMGRNIEGQKKDLNMTKNHIGANLSVTRNFPMKRDHTFSEISRILGT